MIANFTHGSDFKGLVDYANRDDRETDARVIDSRGVCTVTNQSIADSFATQAMMRKDATDPVRHISISFSPEDARRFPNIERGDAFMAHLAREWMTMMGFVNTQYLVVRHNDHDHPHCHIVLNLVDNDGNLLNTSNDLRRNVKVCKAIKKKYGLAFGRTDGKKVNQDRLRGYDKHKYAIMMPALDALAKAKNWSQFRVLLAKEGIAIRVAVSKDGSINGISFQKDDFRISGSSLNKHSLTYGKLAERFGAIEAEAIRDAVVDVHEKFEAAVSQGERFVDDWPYYEAPMPSAVAVSQCAIESTPESGDESGNAHVEVAELMRLLMQAYETNIPSMGGTDTSLDEFRRRKREQEKSSYRPKRR